MPYLGGIAVFMAFLFTTGIFTDFGPDTMGLLLSGSIALMVGLIDDFGAMSAPQKLLGQTLAAVVLVRSGIYIKLEFLPAWAAIPLTIFWVLAVTNALNIIDIHGWARGAALRQSQRCRSPSPTSWPAGMPLRCCRSFWRERSSGFLRHNFHPAKIYLGDAGSLFIGFMLAALSMNAGYTRANLLAVLSPVLILGIPLFDLTARHVDSMAQRHSDDERQSGSLRIAASPAQAFGSRNGGYGLHHRRAVERRRPASEPGHASPGP